MMLSPQNSPGIKPMIAHCHAALRWRRPPMGLYDIHFLLVIHREGAVALSAVCRQDKLKPIRQVRSRWSVLFYMKTSQTAR